MTPPTRIKRIAVALSLSIIGLVLASCAAGVTGDQPKFIFDPESTAEPPARPELVFRDDDRVLVLSPHPDDEVLNTGGVIQEAIRRNLPVEVVFYTTGDNNEFAYLLYSNAFTLDPRSARDAGQTRALEALQAGRQLGLTIRDEIFLGYPDFGTMEIWLNRWGPDREQFISMFTEAGAVPYWFAQTPDALYKGESIMQDLELALLEFRPTVVFLSHTADENPDHAALNLFTRTVLWGLEEQIQPRMYAYLTHYGEWPQPSGLFFEAPHEPPAKFDEDGRWVVLPLTLEEVGRKFEAIKKHDTQYTASPEYLESFMRSNELFDPVVDIQLPSGGEVLLLPSGAGVPAGEELPEGAWFDAAERRVRIEGDELVFSVQLTGESEGMLETDLYLYGYRYDLSFVEMPKLHVAADDSSLKVSERRERVEDSPIGVSRSAGMIEVRIPLDSLYNPDKIFFTAEVQADGKALDTISWVVLDLRAEG